VAVPKIRTLKEAYGMLVKADPDTAITYYHFRRLVLSGLIPHLRCGRRYLIDYEKVEAFFGNPEYPEIERLHEYRETERKIRRLAE